MTRRILAVILMAALLVAAPRLLAVRESKIAPPSFTVLVSDSLSGVMTELVRRYSMRSGNVVTAIFGAPDELQRAILSGDPADLILMEDPALMMTLKQQGLLDVSSQSAIAGNRLVFAASAGHRLARQYPRPVPIADLLKNYHELEMVMADPATLPSGRAASQVFMRLHAWRKIEPLLIRAGSAEDALYLIAKGARTGVVYYTDTVNNPEVVTLAEMPPALHTPVVYQGAVVAGDYMAQARGFLAYLKTAEAQGVLTQYGFAPMADGGKTETHDARHKRG